MTYGYCRISTPKQKIDRQVDNIKKEYPEAVIIKEEYTGTKIDRPAWNKLKGKVIREIQSGEAVTLVFDEVSRMSRNAEEGTALYQELYDMGVSLVFLKEPHINTSVYRDKLKRQIDKISTTGNKATDKLLDSIMAALHEYTIDLAREQIEIAFRTAQAEVDFLHERTSEGVKQAQKRYYQEEVLGVPHRKQLPGRASGVKVETKKAVESKKKIRELSKDFDGMNTDVEVMQILGLARNTYYKYKGQLKEA